MEIKYSGAGQQMRELQANLQGMVPDLSSDGVGFRRAEEGEKPLNSGQRRCIARALIQGHSDEQLREVIGTW